jgi:hypothetical protein
MSGVKQVCGRCAGHVALAPAGLDRRRWHNGISTQPARPYKNNEPGEQAQPTPHHTTQLSPCFRFALLAGARERWQIHGREWRRRSSHRHRRLRRSPAATSTCRERGYRSVARPLPSPSPSFTTLLAYRRAIEVAGFASLVLRACRRRYVRARAGRSRSGCVRARRLSRRVDLRARVRTPRRTYVVARVLNLPAASHAYYAWMVRSRPACCVLLRPWRDDC